MRERFSISQVFAVMFMLCAIPACADRPYYNDKKVPDSKEDLLAIQNSLTKHLERVRKATVCIKIGEGSGSGVIVSEDGLVMSAAHVTSGVGKKLTVVMEDGTELDAVSLGLHSENDAAMLRITKKGKYDFVEVNPAKTAQESRLRLGDWVFSLGHSGGFDKDRGSVVRLGRLIRIANHTIQSDCVLIGGDSGGPLFDMNGVLVGIHSRVGKVANVNMHVPLHVFHTHESALKNGDFIGDGPFAQRAVKGKGFMGVALEEVDKGLKVTKLDEKAPAAKAGVLVGDILTQFDEEVLTDLNSLKKVMKEYAEGDEVKLMLLREGEAEEVKLVLEKR